MSNTVNPATATAINGGQGDGVSTGPVVTEPGAAGAAASSAPPGRRLITFFDGQNLRKCAEELFGYKMATYDPRLLSEHVATRLGCDLVEVRFYTGVHAPTEDPYLYGWLTAKLHRMRNRGIEVTQRTLKYTYKSVTKQDGTTGRVAVPREKGIDLRIGLDMVRLARSRAYDVLVVFSQDNDLGEATDDVKRIAAEQGRFIKVASAYPCGVAAKHPKRRRGIDRTDWIKLTRAEYDACLEAVPTPASVAPDHPVSEGGGAPNRAIVSTGRKQTPASDCQVVSSLGPTAAAAASTAPSPSPRPTDFGAALQAAVEDAKRRAGGKSAG
ncbi:MAG: NYN domain-containing protein [Gemmatimonadaceae bacterium]|nr:NYN domain-containing protein [Gemmatimonadaceae bacterium]